MGAPKGIPRYSFSVTVFAEFLKLKGIYSITPPGNNQSSLHLIKRRHFSLFFLGLFLLFITCFAVANSLEWNAMWTGQNLLCKNCVLVLAQQDLIN